MWFPLSAGWPGPSWIGPSRAEWSPDGSEVAYTTGDDRVYARAVEGSSRRIIVESREPHSLAWSPDGRVLAFVSGNAAFVGPGRLIGNGAPSRIMVVPASGGTPVAITGDNALHTSPTWTADNRHLVFVSNAYGTRDLFAIAMTAEGEPEGVPRRLTAGLNAHTVVLSRNGRRIAFATLTLSSNVWTVPIARRPVSVREAIPVTSGLQIIEGLDVSRDGRWLAFDSNLSGNQDIYRMRLPDGEPEQVTTDPADEFEPTWSSDGSMIAFHGWSSGNRDVFTIGADGQGRERITSGPGHEWFPSWSADGLRIAFADSNRNAVAVIRRQGTGWNTPVVHTTGPFLPAFSPDGRDLLLTGTLATSGEIVVAPVDGGAARVLLRGTVPGTTAIPAFGRWSFDGQRVYFFAIDAQGRSSLWSMPAAGGTPTPAVRFDDPARESNRTEFDVDEKRLYFTLARADGDVWVMDLDAGESGQLSRRTP